VEEEVFIEEVEGGGSRRALSYLHIDIEVGGESITEEKERRGSGVLCYHDYTVT